MTYDRQAEALRAGIKQVRRGGPNLPQHWWGPVAKEVWDVLRLINLVDHADAALRAGDYLKEVARVHGTEHVAFTEDDAGDSYGLLVRATVGRILQAVPEDQRRDTLTQIVAGLKLVAL